MKIFQKNGNVTCVDERKGKKSAKRIDASISSRKAASALNVSQKLIFAILHDDLHYKPYKLHEWHKLEPRDYAAREFASWFLSLPKDTENWFNFLIEKLLHDEKVLMWCAFSSTKISKSVKQYNYLEMLKDFFWSRILKTEEYKKYFFQQDGATPLSAK